MAKYGYYTLKTVARILVTERRIDGRTDGRTDGWMDIGGSRVAFATENDLAPFLRTRLPGLFSQVIVQTNVSFFTNNMKDSIDAPNRNYRNYCSCIV